MRFSTSRAITSYGKIQHLIGRIIRNRQVFIDKDKISRTTLLNVGCGTNIRPGFINLDIEWRPGIDVCWDIRRKLPLKDGTFHGIYTEHCLEHVTYWDCAHALKEFFRILAPGGALRIVVPDGGLYLDLYCRSKLDNTVEFPYVGEKGLLDMEEDGRIRFTSMMAVNRIFRGYGHMFAYDFETLASMLEYYGFKDINRTEYNKGRHNILLIDSELRAPQSLYIEASKPT